MGGVSPIGIVASTTKTHMRSGRLILLPSKFRGTAGSYNSYYGEIDGSLPLRRPRKRITPLPDRSPGLPWASMAGVGSRVRVRLPRFGNEPPVVGARPEREFENAEGVAVGGLTVRARGVHCVVGLPSGPHHELSDAPGVIPGTCGSLRSVALIVVVVPSEDNFGPVVVEQLPEGLELIIVAVVPAREPRVVPVRQRALGVVCSKISHEPLVLGRARTAPTDRRTLRVKRDEVPAGEIEAVPPLAGRPSGCPEVREVSLRTRGQVLVIPRRGEGDALRHSPARSVGEQELLVGTIFILVVPRGQHGIHTIQQIGCVLLPAGGGGPEPPIETRAERVAGDVTRSSNDGRSTQGGGGGKGGGRGGGKGG